MEAEETDGPETVLVERQQVADSGRVTIPKHVRDYLDVDHRSVVNVYVYTDDEAFAVMDAVLDTSNRVTIPERQRRLYGVEDDDRIDMEVEDTGKEMDEEWR